MLVSMKEILVRARAEGYGVTAPNVNNEDTARAAVEAAVENKAPDDLGHGLRRQPGYRVLWPYV